MEGFTGDQPVGPPDLRVDAQREKLCEGILRRCWKNSGKQN